MCLAHGKQRILTSLHMHTYTQASSPGSRVQCPENSFRRPGAFLKVIFSRGCWMLLHLLRPSLRPDRLTPRPQLPRLELESGFYQLCSHGHVRGFQRAFHLASVY